MSWLSRNLAKLGLGDWLTENFPTADSASNDHTADVVGNKSDTVAGTSVVGLVKAIKAKTDNLPADPADDGDIDSQLATIDGNVDTLIANRPKLVERAASTLPQTTQTAYFTVSGKVLISDIVGEVTVEIGAGANNMRIIANPTVGADVDICANLDVDTDAVGTMYHISGTLADALIASTSGAFASQTLPIIVAAGTIDLYCSASKAGQTKWCLYYIPLETGATIVTA
jgi:hypothetical protein